MSDNCHIYPNILQILITVKKWKLIRYEITTHKGITLWDNRAVARLQNKMMQVSSTEYASHYGSLAYPSRKLIFKAGGSEMLF